MASLNGALNVGLIGTGEMARFYAHAIRDHIAGVALTSVGSRSLERAEAFASDFEIPHAHGDHQAVLRDDLDAVVIASATDTHARLIEQAAEHKMNTLCDKPLGVSVEEIDAALAMVAGSSIQVATGFNRRFDPAFQQARRALKNGDIGTPEAVILISRDPVAPTPTELANPNRLFIGTTIHDLDMVRFLMEDEVASLSAHGSWLNPDAVDTDQIDISTISMRFRRGGVGTIINSWRNADGYDQRAEIHGTLGSYNVDNVAEVMPGLSEAAPFYVRRYGASYIAELDSFFTSVKERAWDPVLATATDGRAASVLAEAAVEAWKQQRVVDL